MNNIYTDVINSLAKAKTSLKLAVDALKAGNYDDATVNKAKQGYADYYAYQTALKLVTVNTNFNKGNEAWDTIVELLMPDVMIVENAVSVITAFSSLYGFALE